MANILGIIERRQKWLDVVFNIEHDIKDGDWANKCYQATSMTTTTSFDGREDEEANSSHILCKRITFHDEAIHS